MPLSMNCARVVWCCLIPATLWNSGCCREAQNVTPAMSSCVLRIAGAELHGQSFAVVIDGSGFMAPFLESVRLALLDAMSEAPSECLLAVLRTTSSEPERAWDGLVPNSGSAKRQARAFLASVGLHGTQDYDAALHAAYASGTRSVIFAGAVLPPVSSQEEVVRQWRVNGVRFYVLWLKNAVDAPDPGLAPLAASAGGQLLLADPSYVLFRRHTTIDE